MDVSWYSSNACRPRRGVAWAWMWLTGVSLTLLALPATPQYDDDIPLVTGRVVASTGAPVPGAFVWLKWSARFGQTGTVPGQANEQGRFQFPLDNTEARSVLVGASVTGEGTGLAAVTYPAARIAPVTIRLRRPVVVSGRLIDTSGKPVLGVRLLAAEIQPTDLSGQTARFLVGSAYPAGLPESRPARIAADGRFRLHGIPPHSQVTLELIPPVRPSSAASEQPATPEPPERPSHRLSRGSEAMLLVEEGPELRLGSLVAVRPATLMINVRNRQGKPALRVFRRYRPTPDPGRSRLDRLLTGPDPSAAGLSVAPDDEGVSSIPGLHPGSYDVAVNGYTKTVQLSEGETETVSFQLREAPLRGVVVDAQGQPADSAQVRIEIVPDDGGPPPVWPPAPALTVFTNEHGEFALLGAPWGQERIRLTARRGNALDTFEAAPHALGEPITLRLREDALLNVVGRLLDEDGQPMPGAEVHLVIPSDPARQIPKMFAAFSQTNERGEFLTQGVPRGRELYIQSEAREGAPRTESFRSAATGKQQPVGDLRLRPAASPLPRILVTSGINIWHALRPLPGPLDEHARAAAPETMVRYVRALREGDFEQAQALTHPSTAPRDQPLARYLRETSLRLPAGASELTADQIRPVTGLPTLLVGLALGIPDTALRHAGRDWIPLAYAHAGQVRLLGVVLRDGGRWLVHGSLGGAPDQGEVVASAERFREAYKPPNPTVVGRARLALRSYLVAWRGKDWTALRELTSRESRAYAPDPETFQRRWRNRLDQGAPLRMLDPAAEFVVATRFSGWELSTLLDHSRQVAQLLHPADAGAVEEAASVYERLHRYQAIVPLRYRAGGRDYLALVTRQNGKWRVWEPALPLF